MVSSELVCLLSDRLILIPNGVSSRIPILTFESKFYIQPHLIGGVAHITSATMFILSVIRCMSYRPFSDAPMAARVFRDAAIYYFA